MQKSIQYIIKKNLLLKDLFEPQKIKSTHMSSISKNVYIDKLNDIVAKYNKTYHRTIKMKPIDSL